MYVEGENKYGRNGPRRVVIYLEIEEAEEILQSAGDGKCCLLIDKSTIIHALAQAKEE